MVFILDVLTYLLYLLSKPNIPISYNHDCVSQMCNKRSHKMSFSSQDYNICAKIKHFCNISKKYTFFYLSSFGRCHDNCLPLIFLRNNTCVHTKKNVPLHIGNTLAMCGMLTCPHVLCDNMKSKVLVIYFCDYEKRSNSRWGR